MQPKIRKMLKNKAPENRVYEPIKIFRTMQQNIGSSICLIGARTRNHMPESSISHKIPVKLA
jgi:hypothetical protein